uniref:Tubulin-specific chaperone A n=1 Tax=Steinernema glaseri TaxID=37863 RepID=A0A1I7ZER6_9BILA
MYKQSIRNISLFTGRRAIGLTRDKREIQDKASGVINKAEFNKLKSQVNKLDQLMDDVEKAQEKVRDKLERQIPQDLNELSAKADNIKQQLNARIDQEEEERYLAIRELQEAYNKLLGRPGVAAPTEPSAQQPLRRELDECKVAIKKLAESVTVVKNVLDRKLQDEVRKREQDVDRLSAMIQR